MAMGYRIMRYIKIMMIMMFALVANITFAEIPSVSLQELFGISDYVVRIKFNRCYADNEVYKCEYSVLEDFKGIKSDDMNICTDRDFSDGPGLRGMSGVEAVVFLYRGKGCWRVKYGYRGLVRIKNGFSFAEFGDSRGGGEGVPLNDFLKDLYAISKKK